MTWEGKVSFMLTESLVLKKIDLQGADDLRARLTPAARRGRTGHPRPPSRPYSVSLAASRTNVGPPPCPCTTR